MIRNSFCRFKVLCFSLILIGNAGLAQSYKFQKLTEANVGFKDNTITKATFRQMGAIAIDLHGDIVIADRLNHAIRKVTPSGKVITIAGTGVAGFTDGDGSKAQFNEPTGLAIDKDGNIIVADKNNHRIRKITSQGEVSTIAGNGIAGYKDGSSVAAQFNTPYDVTIDTSGNIIVADTYNHCIRKINSSGAVSTLAGTPFPGYKDDKGIKASFNHPTGLSVDQNGNIVVADLLNHRVRQITTDGMVTTIAGSGSNQTKDGNADAAAIASPYRVEVDYANNIYITQANSNSQKIFIRKIANGTRTVSSISNNAIPSGDNTSVSQEVLNHIAADITTDSLGNLYVVYPDNNSLYKISCSACKGNSFYYISKYFDQPSNTYYYLTRIKPKDRFGNPVKLQLELTNQDKGETVRQFAIRKGSALAFNASTQREVNGIKKPQGTQIVQGAIVQEAPSNAYILGIKADNELKVYPPGTKAKEILNDGSVYALTAFGPLIENYQRASEKAMQIRENYKVKHPRQVIAQFDNKDILFLSCGGRGFEGEGMTAEDVVRILRSLNVKFAYMLDGGGSVSTVVYDQLITPKIDNNGTQERSRPNFLYVMDPTN